MIAYQNSYFQCETGTDFEEFVQQKSADHTQKAILCRRCQHWITTSEHRIIVQGRHQHIVTNPSGIEFQLGCFSKAAGVIEEGISRLENTWFNGFAWRFAKCGGCFNHLGWVYTATGEMPFYGLILNKLIEGSCFC